MKITIFPDNPIIYLGQKFTIQVNISDCEYQIMWLSAQIAGFVKSIKPSTNIVITNLVNDSIGGSQNFPIFGHVVSGSRLISTQINTPKSFCVSISADGIPPSFDGDGISITYELRFIAQIIGQPVNSISIPIRFIAPNSSFTNLEKVQSTASFSIDSIDSTSVPAPFSLECPFQNTPKRPIETFPIKYKNKILANLLMSTDVAAGSEFTGLIDLRSSELQNVPIDIVVISIIQNEIFEATGVNEASVVEVQNYDMRNTISQRFTLPISFETTADFGTNIFYVNYLIEFTFQIGEDVVKFHNPIHIFPPTLSLSIPRSPINRQ